MLFYFQSPSKLDHRTKISLNTKFSKSLDFKRLKLKFVYPIALSILFQHIFDLILQLVQNLCRKLFFFSFLLILSNVSNATCFSQLLPETLELLTQAINQTVINNVAFAIFKQKLCLVKVVLDIFIDFQFFFFFFRLLINLNFNLAICAFFVKDFENLRKALVFLVMVLH